MTPITRIKALRRTSKCPPKVILPDILRLFVSSICIARIILKPLVFGLLYNFSLYRLSFLISVFYTFFPNFRSRIFSHTFLKGTDSLSYSTHQFRYFLASEYKKSNYTDEDYFCSSDRTKYHISNK